MPDEFLAPQQAAKFIECCCKLRDLFRRYCFGETFQQNQIQLNRHYVREWLEGEDRHEYEMAMYNLHLKFGLFH